MKECCKNNVKPRSVLGKTVRWIFWLIIVVVLIIGSFACNERPQSRENSQDSIQAPSVTSEIQTVEGFPLNNIDVFELRVYVVENGKLEDLIQRFKKHTLKLYEKHGITNIAYWVPQNNERNLLVCLLGFESIVQQMDAWEAFRNDREWQAVYYTSRENGPLVRSTRSLLLNRTDFSPEIFVGQKENRLIELVSYTSHEGKLRELKDRFREHTMKILERHGITNIAYFQYFEGQRNEERSLTFILAHPSIEEARKNWDSFFQDPDWQEVYQNSIKNGELLHSSRSDFLVPLDFSPLK